MGFAVRTNCLGSWPLPSLLETSEIGEAQAPLFQTMDKSHRLTGQALSCREQCSASLKAAARMPVFRMGSAESSVWERRRYQAD